MKKGTNVNSQTIAKRMIMDGMSLEKVSRLTELSPEVVAQLAEEISEGREKAGSNLPLETPA